MKWRRKISKKNPPPPCFMYVFLRGSYVFRALNWNILLHMQGGVPKWRLKGQLKTILIV